MCGILVYVGVVLEQINGPSLESLELSLYWLLATHQYYSCSTHIIIEVISSPEMRVANQSDHSSS